MIYKNMKHSKLIQLFALLLGLAAGSILECPLPVGGFTRLSSSANSPLKTRPAAATLIKPSARPAARPSLVAQDVPEQVEPSSDMVTKQRAVGDFLKRLAPDEAGLVTVEFVGLLDLALHAAAQASPLSSEQFAAELRVLANFFSQNPEMQELRPISLFVQTGTAGGKNFGPLAEMVNLFQLERLIASIGQQGLSAGVSKKKINDAVRAARNHFEPIIAQGANPVEITKQVLGRIAQAKAALAKAAVSQAGGAPALPQASKESSAAAPSGADQAAIQAKLDYLQKWRTVVSFAIAAAILAPWL